jgi:hypothetical protein
VIPKSSDELKGVCFGGKSMKIFGSDEIDTKMIAFKKNSEKPIAFKLLFFFYRGQYPISALFSN